MERGGQAPQRALSWQQSRRSPLPSSAERALFDERENSSAAERRFAHSRATAHDDEGLRPKTLEDLGDFLATTKKEGPVPGVERLQPAVGIALRDCNPALGGRELLEGLEQVLPRAEPLGWIRPQTAIQ